MMNQSAVHSHTRLGTMKLTAFHEVPCQVPMITLRIICKTRMNGGFCYLGVDERIPRILRPIYSIEPENCCWDVEFVVGSLIEFQVIHHPDNQASTCILTAYPHRNEDLIVNKGTTAPVLGNEWNPINLLPLCKSNIFEIFPVTVLNIQANKKCFVGENVQCPSAGILLAEQNDVKLHPTDGRIEVHINNCAGPLSNKELIFSYTAMENIRMFLTTQYEYNGKFIVIFGLTRPYAGTIKGQPFIPRRCYVMVVGILGFHMPVQQYQPIM